MTYKAKLLVNFNIGHQVNKTIEYYNQNTQAFFDRTCTRDMSMQYERFLKHLPDGGSILDVGCGPGRDLKYFANHGYAVQGIDASLKMVEFARSFSGQHVQQLCFDELTFNDAFDGIWASASLLHVPSSDLAQTLTCLAAALKENGTLYMSLKEGEGEGIKDDRFFSFWTVQRLQAMLDKHSNFESLDIWRMEPHPEFDEYWICAIVKKNELKCHIG